MSLLDSITRVWEDPPPAFAFELSEAGIAYTGSIKQPEIRFREFETGTISVSPARDNILQPEIFAAQVSALFPNGGRGKRRPATLILPDHSARVQVLDFDSFPSGTDEQLALIRFRVKKSVPFDIDSAAVSYYVQPAAGGKKIEVVAAVISLEIVARYESAFRSAGFVPGFVTTSAVAAVNLMPASGLNTLVKLSGRVLSVLATDGPRLKLVRTVELDEIDGDEILGVLHPTLAFMEDEMASRVSKVYLCGFGALAQRWAAEWEQELSAPVDLLHSKHGVPGPFNAGLLGYLENPGAKQ